MKMSMKMPHIHNMLFSIFIIFVLCVFIKFCMRKMSVVENYNNNDTQSNQAYLPQYNPYTITQTNKNKLVLLKQELNDMQHSITDIQNNNMVLQQNISDNTLQNKNLQENQAIQNKKLQDTQSEFKKKQDDLYNYIYSGYSSHGHNYRYNSKSPYTINTNYNNT